MKIHHYLAEKEVNYQMNCQFFLFLMFNKALKNNY